MFPDAHPVGQDHRQADHPGAGPHNPATGGGSCGQNPPKDPGGDLADTGSGTPVRLIAGIAAALVALGGGLLWGKRRRTAGQE
ncbi:LAETG motif-containing sortase-dependent surface protein [Streptomyces xantholiticus]